MGRKRKILNEFLVSEKELKNAKPKRYGVYIFSQWLPVVGDSRNPNTVRICESILESRHSYAISQVGVMKRGAEIMK